MNYTMITKTGSMVIPAKSSISYKGLEIIGRDSKDWNEPIQQSLIKLVDTIEDKMNSADIPSDAVYTDTVLTDAEIGEMGYIKTIGSIDEFLAALDANA